MKSTFNSSQHFTQRCALFDFFLLSLSLSLSFVLHKAANDTDNDSVAAIEALVSGAKDALRAQLGFIVHVMKPLYEAIHCLQKQSGGINDVMELFGRLSPFLYPCFFFFHSASRKTCRR